MSAVPEPGLAAGGKLALVDGDGDYFRRIVESLPAAVYATDAEGRITYFNDAAAALWGRRPALGEEWWCGSWRLFWPDGAPMAHGECPMALTLKTGKPVLGAEAIAERPDGSRYPFLPYPTPLFDADGKLVGAINLLVDITARKRDEEAAQRLAAIVASSDDAIISKDLNGIITSWNKGAERLFGYAPEEIIGLPVTTLMPPERRDEEPEILDRIRRGERIDHYETVRQRKDGSLVNVSLSVSPVRNEQGKISGAAKIARDVTDRKRDEELKELLLHEIQHRVKNTLGMVQAIATRTFRAAPAEERKSFGARLQTLAAAYDLLTSTNWDRAKVDDIVERALAPFRERHCDRFDVTGYDASVNASKALLLAMIVHELATNAVKFGALSRDGGRVTLTWRAADGRLVGSWHETGGPPVEPPTRRGFGTSLLERALESEHGKVNLDFAPTGLTCDLEIPL